MHLRLMLAALLLAAASLANGCSGGGQSQIGDASPTTRTTATVAGHTATTVTTPAPTRAGGIPNADGQTALKHVQRLANEIGPRVSGTRGEEQATVFIAAELRASGYSVEVMAFTFDGDRFRPGSVSVGGTTEDALAMAGSPGGEVTAATVFVGVGDEAGIAGQAVAGKIAVAYRGTLRFGEKYLNVLRGGAIGLVVVNNGPGLFSGNVGEEAVFPVVAVAGQAGAHLRSAAERGETMTIRAVPAGASTARNVVARARAGEVCRVLVGGHHDSVPGAPGANDNASGTALVIELARAFAADGLDSGLCFATFGAEESGLFGSRELAHAWQQAGSLPAVYVNLDVVGIGDVVEVIGDAALQERALAAAKRLGIRATRSSLPANSGSDHQSFAAAGVSVLFLSSGDFATIHTPEDVAADVQAEELERVAEVAYATIKELLASLAPQSGGT